MSSQKQTGIIRGKETTKFWNKVTIADRDQRDEAYNLPLNSTPDRINTPQIYRTRAVKRIIEGQQARTTSTRAFSLTS
jgi:hypothetical protein